MSDPITTKPTQNDDSGDQNFVQTTRDIILNYILFGTISPETDRRYGITFIILGLLLLLFLTIIVIIVKVTCDLLPERYSNFFKGCCCPRRSCREKRCCCSNCCCLSYFCCCCNNRHSHITMPTDEDISEFNDNEQQYEFNSLTDGKQLVTQQTAESALVDLGENSSKLNSLRSQLSSRSQMSSQNWQNMASTIGAENSNQKNKISMTDSTNSDDTCSVRSSPTDSDSEESIKGNSKVPKSILKPLALKLSIKRPALLAPSKSTIASFESLELGKKSKILTPKSPFMNFYSPTQSSGTGSLGRK